MKAQGIIIGSFVTLFLAIVTIHLIIVGQYGLSAVFGIMFLLGIGATKYEYKEFKNE